MISLFHDFIQIAGVIDRDEAQLLVDCGVETLGFPLRLPVNEVDLSEVEASQIIASLEMPCQAVVITYQDNAKDIENFMAFLGAGIVQLHGDIQFDQIARVRRQRPDLKVIKSLVVGKHENPILRAMVRELGPVVDAFITDTYDSGTGATGATGKAHDWEISRQLVEFSERPVILAGGLHPENVREAILAVRPAGVDVHTGVEAESGRKDRIKVEAFMAEAKLAFSLLKTQFPVYTPRVLL